MKKLAKRFFTVMLTAIMTLAFAATAFADDVEEIPAAATEGTITINSPTEGSTYVVYEVMKATVEGYDADHNPIYSYAISSPFNTFFQDEDAATGYAYSASKGILKDGAEITSADDIAALAIALRNHGSTNGATAVDITAAQPIGYYLVAETATNPANAIATKPVLVNVLGDTTVTLKDDEIDLEKKIVEGTSKVDANDVSIGDTIAYEVTTSIPTYEGNLDESKLTFTFTDTFTNVDFDKESMVVTVGGTALNAGTDYTLTPAEDNRSFTLALTGAVINANQGQSVTLNYSGTLAASANVNSTTGNPNTIKLDYTNNPFNNYSTGTLDDDVVTYTYGFRIRKVDKNDDTKDMSGATFTIKDSDGKTIGSFTYNANGDAVGEQIVVVDGNYAVIKGLDEGTYTITEDQAPAGYSVISGNVTVTITASKDSTSNLPTGEATYNVAGQGTEESDLTFADENSTINFVVRIENVTGISLPETGSTTMMICLVAGALMIIFGGLYFALTRKFAKR